MIDLSPNFATAWDARCALGSEPECLPKKFSSSAVARPV
jgi:hypothetical protein